MVVFPETYLIMHRACCMNHRNNMNTPHWQTDGGFFEATVVLLFFSKYLIRFWFNLGVFRQFWWFWQSGHCFLRRTGVEIIQKHGLEDDSWIFWEAIICATAFLLWNDLFISNYSKRLRWPPIDLRHRVDLKLQNLISKFSKIRRKKTCQVPDYFTLCLTD